ncbi:MAG: OPT family oligopeptide transporter [Proteobacteria bacterium]|nr:OPT family oligopeptide transporter [Pseudomonadota bacterium]
MAIHQLSEEQVRSMTLEEKDRWWLKHCFKGDMPQLTFRSALTGMLIGGILSITNLYVGIKTGWTLGVGITSVVLAFAVFKLFSRFGIGSEIGVLENNAMQSIATSAGYMTAPLVSSISAYMVITGIVIPQYQTMVWISLLSLLGVFFAFPLKKRFINDEQLPFPEGRAAAVVMDSLHSDAGGKEGVLKAKILVFGAALSALIEFLRSEKLLSHLKWEKFRLPGHWDDFLYSMSGFVPKIMGTPLKDLSVRWDSSLVLVATGGLMGTKVGCSLLLGALFNYCVLVPWAISEGLIASSSWKDINMWLLWGGVAMMTTSSLYSFLAKPEFILAAFKRRKEPKQADVLTDIELPLWLSLVGIPVTGLLLLVLGKAWFNIEWWVTVVAIPLVFVFTLIAVTSTGLTAITPGGALGKLTQLTFAILKPGDMGTNIMTAGINSEVALNASNLLMDIKPGYMLGGKPRHQAIGHCLGIIAGALVSVPVFYLLIQNDTSKITSEELPMPGAQIWIAVAKVLSSGLSVLPQSTRFAVLVGGVLGMLIEYMNRKTRGRFPISAMGLGLSFVLRFSDCWSMALGSLIFWMLGRGLKPSQTTAKKIFVENQETACAGVIAGGSIMGIVLIIIEQIILK